MPILLRRGAGDNEAAPRPARFVVPAGANAGRYPERRRSPRDRAAHHLVVVDDRPLIVRIEETHLSVDTRRVKPDVVRGKPGGGVETMQPGVLVTKGLRHYQVG